MKKIIILSTLSLFMLFGLVGCTCNHEWEDATCTEPKTCTKCGKIEGKPLGHIANEEDYAKNDVINAKIVYETKCDRCSKVLSSKEEKIESFVKEGKFNLSPNDFSNRIDAKLDTMSGNSLIAKTAENDAGDFIVAIGDPSSNKTVAGTMFNENFDSSIISYENKDKNGFKGFFVFSYDDDSFARVLLSVILTVDPSLSFDEGKDLATSLLQETTNTKNNITYVITKSNGSYVVGVSAQ